MGEGPVIQAEGGSPSLQHVLDEVNAYFRSDSDRRAISQWMNQVTDMAWDAATANAALWMLKAPLDYEGVPIFPGDELSYVSDGQRVRVIAIDSSNIYYDVNLTAFPTSVAKADQFLHVGAKPPHETLEWLMELPAEEWPEAMEKALSEIEDWYGS